MQSSEFYKILNDNFPGGSLKDSKSDPNRKIYFTRISMDGLEEMHNYSTDDRLYEYLEYEPFKIIDDTRKYLKKLIDLESDDPNGRTAISWFFRRIDDNKMIGTARLVEIDYKRRSVMWGYGIDPRLWGDGYVFEIQELLKEYIFEKLKLNRLSGMTMVENNRTISTLLATGCTEEGILRQYYKKHNGGYHDAWMYSLLADEYYANKLHLEDKKLNKQISKKNIVDIIVKELNDKNINENSDMASISGWDSLSHISIILAIEKVTGFSLTPEQIAQATSIRNIHHIINN